MCMTTRFRSKETNLALFACNIANTVGRPREKKASLVTRSKAKEVVKGQNEGRGMSESKNRQRLSQNITSKKLCAVA